MQTGGWRVLRRTCLPALDHLFTGHAKRHLRQGTRLGSKNAPVPMPGPKTGKTLTDFGILSMLLRYLHDDVIRPSCS